MALLALLPLQVSLGGDAGPELLVTVGDVTDTDAVRWVREHALGGVENFGEVSVDPEGLTVWIVDATGAVRFTHAIGAE